MEKDTEVAGREDKPSFNGVGEFTATVLSPTKLYANGRQQIYLEVLITTMLDGEPYDLKDCEKNSIRLVNYISEAELSAGWKYSEDRNENYEFYSEPGREASTASHSPTPTKVGRYIRNMYVTTTDDAGLSRKLALAITRESDGLVIITNANNDGDYSALDFAVIVEPQRLPTYTTNNYTFEKQRVSGAEGSPVFIDNYYVGLITNSNVPVAFKEMQIKGDDDESKPGGMAKWEDKKPDETFASYVGYGEPGDSKAHYNPNIVLGTHVKEETVRSPIANKGTIILAGDVDIKFHADSANLHGGPCTVNAVDENGNGHTFYIRFGKSAANAEEPAAGAEEPATDAEEPGAASRFDLTLYT